MKPYRLRSIEEAQLWDLISAQREPIKTKKLSQVFSKKTDGFWQREWMTNRLRAWRRKGLVIYVSKGCYRAAPIQH